MKYRDSITDLYKNNKFIILILLGFIVILIGYYYIFFKPAASRFLKFYKHQNELKTHILSTNRDFKNIQNLSKDIAVLRNKGASYRQRLVNEQDLPAFIEELSKIAQDADVKITLIKPIKTDTTRKKEGLISMPVQIEASCGYHELGKFVNSLENHTRFVKVNDIKIKSNPESDRLHNVTLLIQTYALP